MVVLIIAMVGDVFSPAEMGENQSFEQQARYLFTMENEVKSASF